ncbi:hypothetical protein BDN71DRAFT_1430140 [Pleurotus eryngii]|uniref:Uncharacterized protein n=1 Tax=Pleurotus eryngii TaxID=5323 RepID=A0A9P6DGE2_PLEER|nr:hypothetical protein BDN71DRAFT_1430140 [Pleurotus eryngii]
MAQRWQEEMQRIIRFHMWEVGTWATHVREATSSGTCAYAWQQNAGQLHLAAYLKMGEGTVEAGSPLIEVPPQMEEVREQQEGREGGREGGRVIQRPFASQ